MNIVFDLVNVKYKIKYADDVFCKQRSDKVNALGEINSKNRGILKEKTAETCLPADFKYSCTSPSFYYSALTMS